MTNQQGNERDYLLLLEPSAATPALDQLKRVASVIHMHHPRIVIVKTVPSLETRLQEINGVIGIYRRPMQELPTDLTDSERLFVRAWERSFQPKSRPGDGLSWDAPGFVPPDMPPGSISESSKDSD